MEWTAEQNHRILELYGSRSLLVEIVGTVNGEFGLSRSYQNYRDQLRRLFNRLDMELAATASVASRASRRRQERTG